MKDKSKLAHIVLALTMGWSSMYGWSQTDADKVPEPTKTETTQANAAVNDAPGKSDTANDGPIDNTSPFDYQASEEISQDLSVSYPVDI